MEPVIVANREFSVDLLKALLNVNAGKNLVFSPLNISSALGLVLLGAKGSTADQMYESLRFYDRKIMYHDLYEELNKGGSLKLFNHLYGERTLDFKDEFLDKYEEWCFASLRNADFKTNPEAERKRINDWVETKTEGQIKDLLVHGDVTTDTSLALISAMYFKEKWRTGFKPCNNNKDIVPMMDVTQKFRLGDIPEADSHILELPYANEDLSMFILLPNQSDGLPKLVDVITHYKMLEWTDNMPLTKMYVKIPMFQLDQKYHLENVLKTLGIIDVFSDKCDLSGMAPGPLKLSKVVNETFVKVDEEGTEAHGGVYPVVQSYQHVANQKNFIAKHPFLFYIRHNPTYSILFWGRFIPQ